ncbi:unnamed protein product [[Candida] boidinii]|uniref:Unnamed protein product n=1 Tax=Candida boidinii TaxID=5477 RepID=A0ACB5TYV8_CANBO|nr:unnamed protein product [[Candida] boidinii]
MITMSYQYTEDENNPNSNSAGNNNNNTFGMPYSNSSTLMMGSASGSAGTVPTSNLSYQATASSAGQQYTTAMPGSGYQIPQSFQPQPQQQTAGRLSTPVNTAMSQVSTGTPSSVGVPTNYGSFQYPAASMNLGLPQQQQQPYVFDQQQLPKQYTYQMTAQQLQQQQQQQQPSQQLQQQQQSLNSQYMFNNPWRNPHLQYPGQIASNEISGMNSMSGDLNSNGGNEDERIIKLARRKREPKRKSFFNSKNIIGGYDGRKNKNNNSTRTRNSNKQQGRPLAPRTKVRLTLAPSLSLLYSLLVTDSSRNKVNVLKEGSSVH